MLRSRSLFRCASMVASLVVLLSCGAAHDSDEFFVFVTANLQVPYWKAAGTGFAKAADAV